MDIKVDGNRLATELESLRRAEQTGKPERPQNDRVAPQGDRVEVSKDAKVASEAIKAAEKAPEVREEVVERMKKALALGEIGNDPHRLADALLDHMREV